MNRLHHIKQTIPKNILDNIEYKNIEFVLLDYNSNDGLEEWVKEEMQSYMQNGLLKYYRTEEPLFFDRTHSRNLMFRLATGDIICNVDADNYTGLGYAAFVNGEFNNDKDILLVADTKKEFYFLRNAFGRFCCTKENYFKVGGMDEAMKSYGSETLDLYERLSLLGLKEVVIRNTNFLKALVHTDEERIENEFFLKNIESLYIKYHSLSESEMLFLFSNGLYEKCTIVPEEEEIHLPAKLLEGTLERGAWSQQDNLITVGNAVGVLNENEDLRILSAIFYKIDDPRFLLQVAKNYSFIVNSGILKQHKKEKTIRVNSLSLGAATVTLNFHTTMDTLQTTVL